MSVNIYDAANELERTIRKSDEYTRLMQAFKTVNEDETAKKMFEGFREIQIKLQQKQMMGEEVSSEEMEEAQKTVALVQQNQKITELMEAEQRMSVVLADINQVIMKPLEEIYGANN